MGRRRAGVVGKMVVVARANEDGVESEGAGASDVRLTLVAEEVSRRIPPYRT